MTAEYGPFARREFTAADFEDKVERPAAEPRSFSEAEFQTEPRTLSATAEDTLFPGTPVYARRAKRKDAASVIPKAAMVAVPALLLAAGAIYLISRPSSDGLFAETAGQAAPQAVAAAPPLAPSAQQAAPMQQASAPAVTSPAAPTPAVERAAPAPRTQGAARVASARSAPAAVAADADNPQNWATDASATLPEAPVPYSAIGQTSSPSPATAAPPLLDPAPASPAPTEAPADQASAAEGEQPTP